MRDLSSHEERQKGWKQVPRLTRDALRVGWEASRRQLILTVGLQAGAGLAMTLQLLAVQKVISKLLLIAQPETSGSDIVLPFAILIVLMVALGVLTALADQSQRLLGELVAQHAFRKIIGVSTRVDLEAFEDHDFHDQLERARSSAISRSIMLIGAVSSLTMNLMTSAGIIVALLVFGPVLVPLVLASAAPMLIATMLNGRRAYQFEWAMTPENRERAYLMELLTKRDAAKELRVFDAAPFLRERYERLTAERLRRMRNFLRERLGVALLGSISTTVGMGIALAALAYFIATGTIPFSTAIAAGAAMQVLSTRIFGINVALGQVVEAGMFVDDYNSFLKILPEVGGDDRGAERRSARGGAERSHFNGLEVEGVSFTYPGTQRRVLDGVSMHIDPGEVVALVGENGSGKTTLVKLICQLYRAQGGEIRWRGENGGEADPLDVRDDTTVLFQDFLQYHLTVADNIALGRPGRDPTAEAIAAAARQAGAEPLVERFPNGYETRLGRQFADGQELSIGQWQRLSLARAFYRGGGFLVLDEPTASLDPKAEVALFQQMRELWSGRSVLLISHRFSSVRSADRIYVLRDGRIAEAGSHAELMEVGGHYAELFSLQAAAYLDESPGNGNRPGHKKSDAVGVSRS